VRQLNPQIFPGLFSHHSYLFNVIRKPKVPVPLHLFLCFVNLQYVCYDCNLRSQCFPGLPNLGTLVAENAGRSLAEMALECLGANWRQARIVVLAGSGGNGGGGITAARHLANHGAQVELCPATPDKLGEIPAWQRKLFQSTNGREVSPRDLDKGAAWILAASNRTPEGIQIVAAWAEMAGFGSPG
jgi:hypothetical protein